MEAEMVPVQTSTLYLHKRTDPSLNDSSWNATNSGLKQTQIDFGLFSDTVC